MSISFLTSLTEPELKRLLKDVVREVLLESVGSVKQSLPEILNVKQAADFLKLKVNTLYEKTSQKTIPHFKQGNKLYFNLSELQNWISQGKVKTHLEIEGEAITYNLS